MKQLNILIIFALTFCLLNAISNKSSIYYKVHSIEDQLAETINWFNENHMNRAKLDVH